MIDSTKNYSMFKHHPSNREYSQSHVDKLAASISIKNMLHQRPIIVNSEMQIIDGQHRLAAARKLNLSIFYIVDNNSEDVDIVKLNTVTKNWTTDDYFKYYLTQGDPEYRLLREFLDKNKMKFKDFLRFTSSRQGGKFATTFKSGKFKMMDEQTQRKALQLLNLVSELVDFIKNRRSDILQTTNSVNFQKALINFLSRDDININDFKTKLEYRMDYIGGRSHSGGYYLMFIDIYNYKRKDPILA